MFMIVSKSIVFRGFLVANLEKQYGDDFYREVPPMVARGDVKYVEDVTRGLEGVGQAILDVQMGKNKGKSVILLAEQ